MSFIRNNIQTLPFEAMEYVVHVDEKWFNLYKVKNMFYLAPGEKLPERKGKSKRFIEKFMFLSAVARPLWDKRRRQKFDGKLGIWPILHQMSAKRN